MINKLKTTYYANSIISMKCQKVGDVPKIAKPAMLLAIFKLIGEGKILGNKIMFNSELIERYKALHTEYRRGKVSRYDYPFYYMRSDGFYHLRGNTQTKNCTAKFIRDNIEYAYFDDDLWELLQDKETREYFQQVIIDHFLIPQNSEV